MGLSTCSVGQTLRHDLKKLFTWGADWQETDLIFTGRRVNYDREKGTIMVSQEAYVAELELRSLKGYDDNMMLSSEPALFTDYRSSIGSLQWLAGNSRPDVAADCSLLQKPYDQLTIADLKEVHRTLRYVRATASAGYVLNAIPLDNIDDLLFLSFGDAAWANAPGGRSQAGMLILLTTRAVLSSTSPTSICELEKLSPEEGLQVHPRRRGGRDGRGNGPRSIHGLHADGDLGPRVPRHTAGHVPNCNAPRDGLPLPL